MLLPKFCLPLLLIAIAGTVHAQARFTDRDYARKPLWAIMIKDTGANFFTVEHAYKVYFQHHEMPEGEDDQIGEHEKREKKPSAREKRKMVQEDKLRLDVKKYQRWHDRMLPYVQPDGSILTADERLKIWHDNQAKTNK